ncbi:hypothetical protein B566_EDAN012521 [Ephemera danica]|nr:hypothetical protein B566_EDAN012521 [Ephemera danica]
MFRNVPCASNFTLTVATRNWLGIGPAATTRVSTPPEPEAGEDPEAVLLLATQDSIIRLSSDIIEDPVTIFNSSHEILGIAVHVRRNLLFLSDRSGQVSRISLENSPPRSHIVLDGAAHDFAPHTLSVDWLNDLLYVVGEAKGGRWQVVRCRLDGQGFTVAVAGLQARPRHLQVDPYNGYIFWVTEDAHAGGGSKLHRLDLAEVSNGVRHETRPETILERTRLGAFTVDHASFRLLVADPTINSVLAVSLDGKEVSDVRRNTQRPLFKESLKSLVTANGIFYWINGSKVLSEDYHEASKNYYHYTYPQLSRRIQQFVELSVLLPAAQPTPVPVNPPSALQAVLGHNVAKLAWQPPHLLGGQGKGAWQNWSYEVQLRDENCSTVETHLNVTSTSVTLTSLRPDTPYSLKACAYTSAGRGPWSAEFQGRSFRAPLPGHREPSLVWGADEGFMQSDTTGDSVVTLIHSDSLKDGSGQLRVSGVAWYEDKLFLATNASRTLWFNLTSRAQGHVQGVDSAGSIAVDWLGKRLYWSNPKQQLITRGSLDGENQEPLPILTVAKELHIDSVNAFLYWSTGHAVECVRLNGHQRHTYYPAQLFSGKQVMGVTLDQDRRQVFWIVRSYEGSMLFNAPMALDSTSSSITATHRVKFDVTGLMHPVVQGPLCYFSNHLLWLQDSSNAVISDLTGQSAAVISGPGLSGLNALAVVDPAHHINLVGEKVITVIPSLVRQDSIRLVGSWDAFNVTWAAVTNVNFGRVFYEVKFWEQNAKHEISRLTSPACSSPRLYLPTQLLTFRCERSRTGAAIHIAMHQ